MAFLLGMDEDSTLQLFSESVATALRGHTGTANVALLLQVGQEGTEKVKIFENFVSRLVTTIKTCTDGISKVRIQLARERALKRFHQLRLEVLPLIWSDAFLQLGVPEDTVAILQSIRLLFNTIVLDDFSRQYSTPAKSAHRIAMHSDEENAVRYACGYVVKALKKHYEKKTGVKARQFFECLTNMSAAHEESNSSSTYFDYTKAWMSLVNRGGLFEVNTDSFVFFRELEVHVQETLRDHLLSGKMSKQEYLQFLLKSEDIHQLWSRLDADIEDTDTSEELLSAVIQKWVTLRGFALVSSWVEDYKRASAETVKRKKALRKELVAKSKSSSEKKKSIDDAGSSEKVEEKKSVRGKKSLEESEVKRQKLDHAAASDEKTDRSYLRKLLSS